MAELLEALALDSTVRARLARFGGLLAAANARTNLTAARDAGAIAEHVRDSLALAPFVRAPYVDVGSGGGFPGIVLALATGAATTLVESTGKKAKFLVDVARALGLELRVLPQRAEDAGREPGVRATFASATARAVGSLPTVMELTAPLLAVGGVALLQRALVEPAERAAAEDAAPILGLRPLEDIGLEGDLRIVRFIKETETPQRFPRRAGVPSKRPLCLTV
ncbi:MAG: RsmG family class I SAM-dependent methyltransferase [Candidatus Baltobacteraceae bacterium]